MAMGSWRCTEKCELATLFPLFPLFSPFSFLSFPLSPFIPPSLTPLSLSPSLCLFLSPSILLLQLPLSILSLHLSPFLSSLTSFVVLYFKLFTFPRKQSLPGRLWVSVDFVPPGATKCSGGSKTDVWPYQGSVSRTKRISGFCAGSLYWNDRSALSLQRTSVSSHAFFF